MSMSQPELQDQALSKIKFINRILKELAIAQEKKDSDLAKIFENSLKFSLQEISHLVGLLNQIAPNSILKEEQAFFGSSNSFERELLQPRLLSLQKYLLASLL